MKRNSKPARKPKTIDEYLARVSADKRAALQKLRKDIRAAAPKAEECISYGIAAFRLNGKLLVAIGAAARHCAFYPGIHCAGLKERAEEVRHEQGTIRFQEDNPLPGALMRKLVRARIAERN